MNKIIVNGDKIELEISNNIKVTKKEKKDLFDISKLSIIVLKNTNLIIEYKNTTKLDITININDGINFNLYEVREDTNSKIQYNYNIKNNTNIKINKLYDVKKLKEFDILNFEGINSNIEYNFNGIINDKNKIDLIVYSNGKNDISFNSKFITMKEGNISYKIIDDDTKSKIKINTKIMNLNNKKSIIETNKTKNIKFEQEEITNPETKKTNIKDFIDIDIKNKTKLNNIINKYWR